MSKVNEEKVVFQTRLSKEDYSFLLAEFQSKLAEDIADQYYNRDEKEILLRLLGNCDESRASETKEPIRLARRHASWLLKKSKQ